MILLAQCLIKRELFPYCDKQTLKWPPRAARLLKQVQALDSDVACFQEMGNYFDFFKPELGKAGYVTHYYASENKLHGKGIEGCCIAFKGENTCIELDAAEKRPDGSGYCPRSTLTGNVGLVLALRPLAPEYSEETLIIGTCHLYWRPDCDYERLRQAHTFLRATIKFSKGFSNPSILICGDFNSQPYKLPYKAITHAPFDPVQFDATVLDLNQFYRKAEEELTAADELLKAKNDELVHLNTTHKIEAPTAPPKKKGSQKLAPQQTLQKQIIKLEREVARLRDRLTFEKSLLPPSELYQDVLSQPRLISIYATYATLDPSYLSDTWGADPRAPSLEPKFTHFTDTFRSTLDYIFMVDGFSRFTPTHVLALPDPSTFGVGLPNHTHPSDHLPIMGIFRLIR
ncbi:RNA exonuclease ngl2 [Massospora cicadina]|nr:RNA exonuclease ngl2 [Massospora cicadina]